MPLIDLWIFISFLADRNILTVVLSALIIYFLYEKKIKDAVFIFIGYVGGIILNKLLKEIFQIPRPADALIQVEGYAFPSGHAMSAVLFYSLMIILFSKKIKDKTARTIFVTANILIILLVGLSRIMLKVHTVYDVVGGYIIGLLWLFILYKVYNLQNIRKIKF